MVEAEALNDLRERVARLEKAAGQKRRYLNQKQAAEYLGRSDEYLRLEHAAGRGPKRHRFGTRGWRYNTTDLDAYIVEGDAA